MRVHLHMLYTGVHVYKHIVMAQIISYIYAFMVLRAQLHCVPLLITTPTSITAAVRAAITMITPATTMPAIAPALNAQRRWLRGQGSPVHVGGKRSIICAGNNI